MSMNVRLLANSTNNTITNSDGSTKAATEELKESYGALHTTNGLGPRDTAAGQELSISSSATQSTALNTTAVDIMADALCFVAIGTNPTAVAGTSYACAANTTYRFPIQSGDKVSIVTKGATTGTAWVHEVK